MAIGVCSGRQFEPAIQSTEIYIQQQISSSNSQQGQLKTSHTPATLLKVPTDALHNTTQELLQTLLLAVLYSLLESWMYATPHSTYSLNDVCKVCYHAIKVHIPGHGAVCTQHTGSSVTIHRVPTEHPPITYQYLSTISIVLSAHTASVKLQIAADPSLHMCSKGLSTSQRWYRALHSLC